MTKETDNARAALPRRCKHELTASLCPFCPDEETDSSSVSQERLRIAAYVRARGDALRGLAAWKAEAFHALAEDIEKDLT